MIRCDSTRNGQAEGLSVHPSVCLFRVKSHQTDSEKDVHGGPLKLRVTWELVFGSFPLAS